MKLIIVLVSYLAFLHAVLGAADECKAENCAIADNCRCSSVTSPLPENAPQLIVLTFDESVVDNVYTDVWEGLLFDRKNPDGNPISGTFFVPHEYTNYKRVQDLYVAGFEIGVNSITKNSLAQYWAEATLEVLSQEFGGQRTIVSNFAKIPIEDVVGARTPQLQIEDDVTIEAYIGSGIQYDNSWTSRSNAPLFPYTLDYLSTQECRTGTTCPEESHPGFWIAPIINIQGNGSVECNSFSICAIEGSSDEISDWLLGEVNRVRNGNRAPMTLMVASSWFRFTNNSYEGFGKFLDSLAGLNDVYLVSQKQVIDWMKNPIPVDQFQTETFDRTSDCLNVNCLLYNEQGDTRYMVSCVSCPEVYPWLGNPLGLSNPNQTTTTTPAPPTTTPPPEQR